MDICCSVLMSYSTLCDPMDCDTPGFSVYGIHQARILEWAAISSSRGSSWLRDQTLCLLHWQAGSLPLALFNKLLLADGMEKVIAPHSSTLAWKIPWTEEPGRLQSMGLWRVRHDWVTSFSLFTFTHWRRKWQPTPVFLPGESQDRGAWWAAVYGITQNWTQLKWLSSSSSRW